MAGAVAVKERHSITEPGSFNIFMSDIDLTVVSSTDRFKFLHQISKAIKKVILNLGEIEFLSPEEWVKLRPLLDSNHSKTWTILFTLRKISWMKSELKRETTPYQKLKLERGIANAFRKIGVSGYPINGEGLIPFQDSRGGKFPLFSNFLNHSVTINGVGEVLSFTHESKASGFLAILPDNSEIPTDLGVKKYLMEREMYLTIVSLRNDELSEKFDQIEQKKYWIQNLQEKISALG